MKTLSPTISIVLPTYNRAEVIGFAIQSALIQTRQDFELLIAGDGCTDNTSEVVQSFADKRISWFDLPKAPGFGYANRNVVLRRARGHIVAYLSHDDFWFPDHLERLTRHLEEYDADIAYSLHLDVSMSGYITPVVFNLNDPRALHRWYRDSIGCISISDVVHRRSCLDHYGFWNEKMLRGGDWELWQRIIARGQPKSPAYLAIPTSLHFVANWRRKEDSWRRRLRLKLQAWEKALLPELKIDIPRGQTEQEAVWRAISRDPGRWTRSIRSAVRVDLDRRTTGEFLVSGMLELLKRRY